jgi:hypothetical protein
MYQCYQYKACNIRRHVYLQHGNQSLVFFASASLKHQGLVALSPSVASPVSRATPWCAAPPPLMATDDDHHGAKFRKKLDAMVAAATNVKKRYDATRTRVLAATALLEEEQCTVVILIEEAHVMVALIEPPSPTLPPAPIGGAALSDDDYEAIIITNIHVQAISVQNICSLISVMLDLSSTHYTRWRDSILLTLGRYSLSNHILMDTMYVDVPFWDQMESVIKSWIYDTISHDLQDVTRQRGHTARDAWLALENHFLGNHETRTLHIDATFRSFVQGNLSINDYCQKMKGFAESLTDLDVNVTNRVLVLNVLRRLKKKVLDDLLAIFMHVTPFPLFQKVLGDLFLEEIQ